MATEDGAVNTTGGSIIAKIVKDSVFVHIIVGKQHVNYVVEPIYVFTIDSNFLAKTVLVLHCALILNKNHSARNVRV